MEVIDIAKKIEQYGGRLYLVGGAVRDEFLKVMLSTTSIIIRLIIS